MLRLTIFLSIILLSCDVDPASIKPFANEGMRPIYGQIGDDIAQEAIQFDDLTNIVIYQELILAMEENVGIHIIDNSDPTNPSNALFVPISGIDDVVIKEDIIIANAGGSLYSIDISDRTKAIFKAITYVEGGNTTGSNLYPAGYNGFFECVNPENGLVVSWVLVSMNDSDCWR